MKFDSNRAWREASASASANREVLLAVAGVFFLLPGLASVLFLSDFQADMMANFGNPAAAERILATLIANGTLTGGMIPKAQGCIDAVHGGVRTVHMVNGTVAHVLLLELFTDEGIGTMITAAPSAPSPSSTEPQTADHQPTGTR